MDEFIKGFKTVVNLQFIGALFGLFGFFLLFLIGLLFIKIFGM